MENTKKITKATLKSFINKNKENLFSKEKSSFDGMEDCVTQTSCSRFRRIESIDISSKNTLGIKDLWLVDVSENYFARYEDENFIGIEGTNCCGNWIVAIKKTA